MSDKVFGFDFGYDDSITGAYVVAKVPNGLQIVKLDDVNTKYFISDKQVRDILDNTRKNWIKNLKVNFVCQEKEKV